MTFPEYRQAAEAAVKYINDYKGGIGGRPVELASCATDGQPSTSARCAGQIVDKKPAFDPRRRRHRRARARSRSTSAPSSPTSAASRSRRSRATRRTRSSSISISIGDNAAAVEYAVEELGVKKASVIYTDDTQGKATGLGVIAPALQGRGRRRQGDRRSPPSAADLSSVAASAIQSAARPDLRQLAERVPGHPEGAQVGRQHRRSSPASTRARRRRRSRPRATRPRASTSPQPFDSLDAGTDDANLFLAAMEKYGRQGRRARLDRAGRLQLGHQRPGARSTASRTSTPRAILAAFKDGQAHPNFLAHEYTCDGKQLAGQRRRSATPTSRSSRSRAARSSPVDDEWVTRRRHLHSRPQLARAAARPCPPTSSSCCSASGRAPSTASSPSAWCSSTAAAGVVDFGHGAVAMFIAYVYLGLRADGSLQFPWIVLPHEIDLGDAARDRPGDRVSLVYAAVLGAAHVLADLPAAAAGDGADPRVRLGRHDARAAGDRGAQLRHDGEVDAGDPALAAAAASAGITVPSDRLWFAGIVIVLAAVLALVYRFTRFGLATRASAENERGAALVGLSADRIGAGNWVLATLLAGLAGILIAPVSTVDPTSYTLFIVPALGVALVARFTSFAVAAVAGLVLGMLQSEITKLLTVWTGCREQGAAAGAAVPPDHGRDDAVLARRRRARRRWASCATRRSGRPSRPVRDDARCASSSAWSCCSSLHGLAARRRSSPRSSHLPGAVAGGADRLRRAGLAGADVVRGLSGVHAQPPRRGRRAPVPVRRCCSPR